MPRRSVILTKLFLGKLMGDTCKPELNVHPFTSNVHVALPSCQRDVTHQYKQIQYWWNRDYVVDTKVHVFS